MLPSSVKKLSVYVALVVSLMMLFKHRYPSAYFSIAVAMLALTIQHL